MTYSRETTTARTLAGPGAFVRSVPIIGTLSEDLHALGEKGASVVALSRMRIPQPPSFVVAGDALERLVNGGAGEQRAVAQLIAARARPLLAEARCRLFGQTTRGLIDATGLIVRGSPRTSQRGVGLSLRNIALDGLDILDRRPTRGLPPQSRTAMAVPPARCNPSGSPAPIRAGGPQPVDSGELLTLADAVRVAALHNAEHRSTALQLRTGAERFGSVIVQSLVPFDRAVGGSGVACSRDPNAGGSECLFGDFVSGVTGRALTLGKAPVISVARFCADHPEAGRDLVQALAVVEAEWKTVVEFEFVYTGSQLLVVQAARAAMSPLATVRNALELWRDGVVSARETLRMVTDDVLARARATELLLPYATRVVQGRGAAVGTVSGPVAAQATGTASDPPRWSVGDPRSPQAQIRAHGGVAGHGPANARRSHTALVVGVDPDELARLLALTGGQAAVDGLQGLVAPPQTPRVRIDLTDEETWLEAAVWDHNA